MTRTLGATSVLSFVHQASMGKRLLLFELFVWRLSNCRRRQATPSTMECCGGSDIARRIIGIRLRKLRVKLKQY